MTDAAMIDAIRTDPPPRYIPGVVANRLAIVAILAWIGICPGQVTSAQAPLAQQTPQWTPAELARGELPSERSYQYEFSDVDIDSIKEWLEWFSIELPIEIDGNVSGWLWVQRSARGWLNVSGYRVEGELRSAKLDVESWQISDALLRLGYAGGRWRLGRLSGSIGAEKGESEVGSVKVVADIPNQNPRTIVAEIQATRFQLGPVLKQLDADIGISHYPATAVLSARVPLASLRDLSTWAATGRVAFPRLTLGPLAGRAATEFVLAEGQWRSDRESFFVEGFPVNISAKGTLTDAFEYEIQLADSDVDLAKLSAVWDEPNLSRTLTGKLLIDGQLTGDLVAGLDNLELKAASDSVRFANTEFGRLTLVARGEALQGGKLPIAVALTSLVGTTGSVSGDLIWPSLTDIGILPGSADFSLRAVQLSWLGELVGSRITGVASGDLSLSTRTVDNRGDWDSDVQILVTQFGLADQTLGDLQLAITKQAGEPTLNVSLGSPDESMKANCVARLVEPAAQPSFKIAGYQATGQFNQFTSQLRVATNQATVPIEASGSFHLQGDSFNWLASGKAELESVIAVIGPRRVELYDVQANVTPKALRLESFRIRDGVGKVLGSLLIRRDTHDDHLLNLRVSGVDVSPYWKELAPANAPSIEGDVAVDVRLEKPARDRNWTSGWQGTCLGSLEGVKIRDVAAGELQLDGNIDNDQLALHAKGEILGGTCELQLDAKAIAKSDDESSRHWQLDRCDASVDGCELDRLMACIFGVREGIHYDGRANLTLRGSQAMNFPLEWRATCDIPSFGYQRRSLARNLAAAIRLKAGVWTIERLSGGFAGGRVAATGQLQNSQSGDSLVGNLRFSAQQLQIPALVAYVAPTVCDRFAGEVTYRGSASISGEPTLYGDCRIRDASAFGLPVQDLRTRLRVVSSPRRGGLHVSGLDVHGEVLGGRASGEFQLRGGSRWELESSAKLAGGHLEQLSKSLGFEHIVGSGRFDAAAAIRSKDVFSLASFAGPIQVDFEGGDARSVPILSDLGRLIPLVNMATADITGGMLRAQLGQGILRIQTIFVHSDSFWLLGDGNASLASHRLDLDAVLQTGSGFDRELAQMTLQKVAELAVPQIAVASQINDLLRNRTLFFHVGGTSNHPVVRLKAAQTIAKAFIQNLQRQLLVLPEVPDPKNQ